MSLFKKGGSHGRKEGGPQPTEFVSPSNRGLSPDVSQPDLYASVVSFYAGGRMPLDEIRPQLVNQYKGEPEIVDAIANRIITAREEAAKKGRQH